MSEVSAKDSHSLFHLDASTDDLLPCVMYLPSNVIGIEWLKYNIGPSLTDMNYRDLEYLPVDDFLTRIDGLSVDDSWVQTQDVVLNGQTFIMKFRNDESPYFYTSPDDKTIIFDSYDASYEDTLTSARTYGLGPTIPVFTMADTYVPDLDPRQFTLLLNASKAAAFLELKQTPNDRAEKKERRHKILAYKTKDNTDDRTALRKHKGYGR